MQKIIYLILQAGLLVLCGTSGWAATVLQFTLVRDYLIVVNVRVNDGAPQEFLLDTGTNTTMLHTEFAAELGLPIRDRIELLTVAGSQIVPRAFVPALTLGEKTARNLEVLVSDLRVIRALLPNVRGVLGQNFLTQFNFLLEYPERRISFLNEPDARWCGEQVPLLDDEGRMLLQTPTGGRWVLDSALADLLLFSVPGRGLDLIPHSFRPMQLTSDLSSRRVSQATLRRFRIGHIEWRALPVTLAPAEARTEEGLLPLRMFHSVYFNHAQKYVWLNPLLPSPLSTNKAP